MAANELQNILEEIRADKNAHLKPRNLKKNVTVLGITGTLDGGIDTEDATATAADILEGETAYAKDEKLTGTMPNNGLLNYNPLTSEQLIPAGYTSGGRIAPVTSSIDPNITQANIRAGVSILGVQGNLQPDKPDQTKTATPTTFQQIIEPDTGYELASVTINAVTSSIDQNIIADNIREGVTILGITGTLEEGIDTTDATAVAGDIMLGKTAYAQGEKVTGTFTIESELSAQEQKLEALETILEGKVGGGTVRANIYVQENEPTKKDGIWLKMSGKTAEHYISDDNVFVGGTWLNDGIISPIPYKFAVGKVTSVGTDIYLIGGYNNRQYNYKYDTLTDTYTRMADIPYSFDNGAVTSVGTDIYIMGSNNTTTGVYNYKYDTLTDTYTKMTNIPYVFCASYSAVVGTDIYIFGGYNSSSSSVNNYTYKYNTITDTWTKLSNMPTGFYDGSLSSVGTDIYIFGNGNSYLVSSYKTYVYKYDTLTDTYTRMTNIPYQFTNSYTVSKYTDIYLLGGYDSPKYMYKYDTLTDTYTRLIDIPKEFVSSTAAVVGENIYLLGGQGDNCYNNQVYALQSKTYSTDNTVVIFQGRTYSVGYNTKLFETNFESDYQPLYGFADVWFYTLQDGLDGTMPVYYGDGTQWINIKNPPQNNGGEE